MVAISFESKQHALMSEEAHEFGDGLAATSHARVQRVKAGVGEGGHVGPAERLQEVFRPTLRLQPNERGHLLRMGARQVFANGVKFSVQLGNAGTSDIVINGMRLDIRFEEFDPIVMEDRDRRYGGMYVPHQLFVDLYRDGAPGWWLLSEGVKHAEPRPFADAREDLLASAGCPRMQFRLASGELEVVEGGLIPREPGLFGVRFVFNAISVTETVMFRTDEILVAVAGIDRAR